MNAADALFHVERRLPGFRPRPAAEPLSGGLLNETFRVRGDGGSVVVKHAPPYIASLPDVPLDPSRIAFEARALADLAPDGRLGGVPERRVRPPRLLDYDAEAATVILEDLGRLPHLGGLLEEGGAGAPKAGQRLGGFIGRLHAATARPWAGGGEYHNLPVQVSRHAVQYSQVREFLEQAGVPDAEACGKRAAELGERLVEPGRCLIMGDLWPPSVLVDGTALRLIDWEFCHYGHPAQDVAHLAAHVVITASVARTDHAGGMARNFWRSFASAYVNALDAKAVELLDAGIRRDVHTHLGAEILARLVGPFRAGSPFADIPDDAPACRAALQTALRHLRAHAPAARLADLV